MRRQLVLGVDAGGTKTKVLLGEIVDGQLQRVGEAVGAAGNPRSVGFEVALNTIRTTIDQAYKNSGTEFTTATSACFCVAGAGRSEERQKIRQWCSEQQIATKALVVGDAECLLAAAQGNGTGVALIVGTGSMAWGRTSSGKSARAGGCGYLFDDEGSAYWIAANALRHVCMAADARKCSTSLARAILEHLQLSHSQELIGWCYEASSPRGQIASLAPIVFQEYTHDQVAQRIVQAGAEAIANLVASVVRELGFSKQGFRLACSGSVVLRQPIYAALIEAQLARQQLAPSEIYRVDDPSHGAMHIAVANA